jgi:uncharacterized protein with HEPN domain
VGELTKRLSPEFRQQHDRIPWREIAGMRDVVVHDYDHVRLEIVWNVVQNQLSEFQMFLKSL